MVLLYLNFSIQVFEKLSNIQLRENPPVRAELFHGDKRTDGRTGMTKLIGALRNFSNTPKTPTDNTVLQISRCSF
jgi:hypothetical protein